MNAMLMNLGLAPIPATPKYQAPQKAQWSPADKRWAIARKAHQASLVKRSHMKEKKVAAILAACEQPSSVTDIMAITLISKTHVQKTLNELMAAGKIKRERYSTNVYYYERVRCQD